VGVRLATVGTGAHAIGVTEVLAFHTTSQRWRFVSRSLDCKASILPASSTTGLLLELSQRFRGGRGRNRTRRRDVLVVAGAVW